MVVEPMVTKEIQDIVKGGCHVKGRGSDMIGMQFKGP